MVSVADGETLLNLQEGTEITGISRPSIYVRIRSGNFPTPLKVGRNIKWRVSQIDEWIATLPEAKSLR